MWLVAIARLVPGASIQRAQAEVSAIAAGLRATYPKESDIDGVRVNQLSLVPGDGHKVIAGFMAVLFAVGGLGAGDREHECRRYAPRARERTTARDRGALGAWGVAISHRQPAHHREPRGWRWSGRGGARIGQCDRTIDHERRAAAADSHRRASDDDRRPRSRFCARRYAPDRRRDRTGAGTWRARNRISSRRSSSTPGRTPRRRRLRGALAVAQVAVSMLLLVVTVLFGRALVQARAVDPGFATDHIDVVSLDLSLAGYDPRRGASQAQALLDATRRVPGVQHAALSALVPLAGSAMSVGEIRVDGRAAPKPADFWEANANVVSPGYFDVLGIPILHGRTFTDGDQAGTPRRRDLEPDICQASTWNDGRRRPDVP